MAIPVPVQNTPLPATDAQIARAEELLQIMLRVMHSGTIGATVNTKPTYVQNQVNESPSPINLEREDQQHFLRQLATAIATWVPSTPPPPPVGELPIQFTATCPSNANVGDLVHSVPGAAVVELLDITDFSKLPCTGCIISKATTTNCVVQTGSIVDGVYTGLIAGKTYFAGTGPNPRPVHIPPVPPSGSSLFVHPIGVAISGTALSLSSGTSLVKILGR